MDELQAADLTAEEARALTDRIKASAAELLPLIREAFERRADIALGYQNWQAYCDGELLGLRLPVGERRVAVAELRSAGMSTRAIGSALGVGVGTVHRDLAATVPSGTVESVTSLDGRERPAARIEPVGQREARAAYLAYEAQRQVREATPVAEAIEQHLPVDPDDEHREWRRQFLATLGVGRRAMQFDVDSVAARADDECIDELGRLAADIASFVSRVAAKRTTTDNVRRLRAV